MLKLDKINATPYQVAAGFACGAAVSFTPFVGFHTLLALVAAFAIRANMVASAIGTLVGNPWTFPFIWPATLWMGRLFFRADSQNSVDFIDLFKNLTHAVLKLDFGLFVSDIWPILLPMMIGCIPYVIVVWAISYFFIKRGLDKFQERRERLRRKQ